jgi:acyl-CoA synthetase (AMP-forming)/AMP-acid ligase II/acyl carrier protein
MPTDLFVRRPLLWMTFCARKQATITSSPNFGYRHYLKVLGDRDPGQMDLSSVRLIFNGAEPISVELADEFMTRLAPAGLKRTAMYPVYGLAEATLVVSFPQPPEQPYEHISVNRHELNDGTQPATVSHDHPDALSIMAVGQPVPYSNVRIAADDDSALPENRIGHILISGDHVTKGYYENPEANAQGYTAADSSGIRWLRTGDLGMLKDGKLYITGRFKEIIFVNGQNYYPHDIENIAIRAEGLELGKVVASGVRPKGASTDDLIIFVLHRMDMKEFLPTATQVARLVNEHTGLEVAHVVPVKRIPKTTSGKIQRHLMEEDYVNGMYAAELGELDALRAAAEAAGGAKLTSNQIERNIKDICDAALERNIDVNDNLFELGASSLKLIEIHEQIDRVYPGKVDLTELFDFPTIADLSRHLEGKLAATV